jgi:hypothetical protein
MSASMFAAVASPPEPCGLASSGCDLPAPSRSASPLLIIDTKGQLPAATVAAIQATSLVVSPVRPSLFDLLALKDIILLIEQAGKLSAAVCVVNGIQPGKGQESTYSEAELAASSFGIKVAPSPAYLCPRAAYVKAIGAARRFSVAGDCLELVQQVGAFVPLFLGACLRFVRSDRIRVKNAQTSRISCPRGSNSVTHFPAPLGADAHLPPSRRGKRASRLGLVRP